MTFARIVGSLSFVLAIGAVSIAPSAALSQTAPATPAASGKAAPAAMPALEQKAIDILKASSARLAAAHSMSFTAVVTYENPTRLGLPLAYTTKSDVVLQRPDKLRVITLADGPASEFYYDGKVMMAYSPAEDLVAVADAPPTIDATLETAYHSAAIYFPFDDVIVADPYKDIAADLRIAFYVGQSNVIGGTTTDIVAYDSGGVFVEAWIGVEDKLPRMLRAIYTDDQLGLRHQLELSNWKIDPPVSADFFSSAKAAKAKRIAFAAPNPATTKPASTPATAPKTNP